MGTQMVIVVVFIRAPNWKQFKCPSAGEWIKIVVYPYNGLLLNSEKEYLLIYPTT